MIGGSRGVGSGKKAAAGRHSGGQEAPLSRFGSQPADAPPGGDDPSGLDPSVAGAFWYAEDGRSLNQFGSPIDTPIAPPEWAVSTPSRRAGWRTSAPRPARRAGWIALVSGAFSIFAGVLGQRASNMGVVQPDGTVKDATGAIYTAAQWATDDAVIRQALLIGLATLALGLLTLVGIRLAGAGLLVVFGVALGAHVLSLVTIGADYLLHGSLISFVLCLVAFLSLINRRTLNWILRG